MMAAQGEISEKLQQITPTYWECNTNECRNFIENPSVLHSIPLLNYAPIHHLTDHQLVRFRGMVQDMYDPEIYLAKFEVKNTQDGKRSVKSGQYRDIVLCENNEEFIEHSPHNVNSERQTLYCVSVPATNSWVTNLERTQSSVSAPIIAPISGQSGEKRSLEETNLVSADINSMLVDEQSSSQVESKRLCASTSGHQLASHQEAFSLNLPLPDPEGKACIIKVYDGEEMLALNNIVEVVGFLSLNPQLDAAIHHGADIDIELQSDHHPPPSLVPRLHAVSIKKLTHCNPLVPLHETLDNHIACAKSAHEDLHLILTQILLGDELAADFLICHLISNVYVRRDMLALGQLTLNIFNVPLGRDYINQVYEFFELLLTNSHLLPMTLQQLNTTLFVPRKDYTKNRLSSGVLQLAPNTHLVLDETALQPGQLNNTGVNNMTALKNVIMLQKVDYDFQYYQLEFETNLSVLVLSEGKTLLPCDVCVKLLPDSTCVNTMTEIFQAARHYLQDERLSKLRAYFTIMKHAPFILPDDMQEVIQTDFVQMRQEDAKASPADLQLLILLSRLVSLSRGKTSLTRDMWDHARNMVRRLRERCSNGQSN